MYSSSITTLKANQPMKNRPLEVPMIFTADVHYSGNNASAARLLFSDWQSDKVEIRYSKVSYHQHAWSTSTRSPAQTC